MVYVSDPEGAIVSIWHREVGGNGTFLGSGAFVSARFVLTARHVMDVKKYPDGFFLGLVYKRHSVLVANEKLHIHEIHDVALIELDMDYPQSLIELDWETSPLEGKVVDLHGVHPEDLMSAQRRNCTVETCSAAQCKSDNRHRKGYSGGIVVLGGRGVGVITQRHQDEQQGVFVPLYAFRDWAWNILYPGRLAPWLGGRHNASPQRTFQPQTEFTRQIRREITKFLKRSRLKPLRDTLAKQLPNDNPAEAGPETVLVPLEKSVSVEQAVRTLHRFTRKCLEDLSDHDPQSLPDVAAGATDILGWLVLLAVSDEWVRKAIVNAQYVEMPLKTVTGTEVVVARLRSHPARYCLPEGSVRVDGANRIAVGELERGLLPEDRLIELKKLIYAAVLQSTPPQPFDHDAEEELRATLEFRDDEHYYVTIPASQCEVQIGDPALLGRLCQDLPYLGAFLIGAESGDRVLVLEEPRFVALVNEFIRMLDKFS